MSNGEMDDVNLISISMNNLNPKEGLFLKYNSILVLLLNLIQKFKPP
jgi:hypothetical protein